MGAGVARAQTLSIVSGNNQLVGAERISSAMVVLLRDAGGKPLPNAKVTWSVPSGQGVVNPLITTTDATGQASATYIASLPAQFASFSSTTVTAAYTNTTAQFTVTTAGISTQSVTEVQAFLETPSLAQQPLTGAAGQQGSVPVTVLVQATFGPQSGHGVPNVGITVAPDQAGTVSTIGCAGGLAVTNATGNAICNLVFGGKIGGGTFTVSVGGGYQSFRLTYKVVAGAPGALVVISGNNQSGTPGRALPIPLKAQLTDVGGNVLAGVPMTFAPVVPGTVTLTKVTSVTDANGYASAYATLGNVAGAAQVKLSTQDGTVSTLFNLTVNIIIAGMTSIAGDGQSVLVSTQFPDPLIVQVNDTANNPVAGAPVTFAVTSASGSAALGNTSVTTGADGQASTIVTAGPTPGPIQVTASTTAGSNTYSQVFNLTATPPGPVCEPGNTFFNGASFAPNFISPGGVAVLYCAGLAPGIQGVVTSNTYGFGPLPLEVQHVTIEFNGVKAPIYYLANVNGKESIAVQVPFETAPGSAVPVVVTVNGEPNAVPLTAQVLPGAPGFFETVMSDGNSRAVLLHADGSVVEIDHRAHQGETIRAFVTGMIPPTTSSGASEIGTNDFVPLGSDITVTTPIIVGVGHEGVAPPTAIYAHDLIGVWEVQFVVPSDAPSGNDIKLNLGIPDPATGKLILNRRGSKIPIQ